MEIFNFMESIVEETLGEMLPHQKGVCSCQECRYKITAAALNRLPPMYIVTKKGRAYSRIQGVDNQYKADVMRELISVIKETGRPAPHT